MAETHIYTVNLNKAKAVSRNQRTARAVRILKEYVQQHSKVTDVSISNALNEHLWEKGGQNPPKAVEIQVIEDDGTAHVELADVEFELEEPEPEEEEPVQEDLSDEEIAEKNVDEVKDLVRDNVVEAQRALDIEYAGKNRKTLIEWLENRLEEPEEPDEDVEEAETEEEASDETENEESEETYDLPDDVAETFRDGTIDEGKDAAQDLGKSEFEKLLNFEEAHQNREGMKKFLRSNMN